MSVFRRYDYSKYGHGLKTRIIVVAIRAGKKVYYRWHVEQESSWATDKERETEGFEERPKEWRRVQAHVFVDDDIWNPFVNDLYGNEKTHHRSELAARIELAKVVAWHNERDRNKEWEENNTTTLDA